MDWTSDAYMQRVRKFMRPSINQQGDRVSWSIGEMKTSVGRDVDGRTRAVRKWRDAMEEMRPTAGGGMVSGRRAAGGGRRAGQRN
jgi:hypothetical protein